MKKKIKDLTRKQIFEAIYNNSETSIADDNCQFCKYCDTNCKFACNVEYETCIDYEEIIDIVGEEEVEVEEDE